MSDLILLVILLFVGFTVGSFLESRHYKQINEKEKLFINLPAVTAEKVLDPALEIKNVKFVHGSVVISSDFFKDFVAGLKTTFGGRLSTYESLMDRARREAVLRMKQMAANSDIIINTRIDTSEISRKSKGMCIEVIATGTAITYK